MVLRCIIRARVEFIFFNMAMIRTRLELRNWKGWKLFINIISNKIINWLTNDFCWSNGTLGCENVFFRNILTSSHCCNNNSKGDVLVLCFIHCKFNNSIFYNSFSNHVALCKFLGLFFHAIQLITFDGTYRICEEFVYIECWSIPIYMVYVGIIHAWLFDCWWIFIALCFVCDFIWPVFFTSCCSYFEIICECSKNLFIKWENNLWFCFFIFLLKGRMKLLINFKFLIQFILFNLTHIRFRFKFI